MASLEATGMVMGFDLNERHCQCHPNAGICGGAETSVLGDMVVDDVQTPM